MGPAGFERGAALGELESIESRAGDGLNYYARLIRADRQTRLTP